MKILKAWLIIQALSRDSMFSVSEIICHVDPASVSTPTDQDNGRAVKECCTDRPRLCSPTSCRRQDLAPE